MNAILQDSQYAAFIFRESWLSASLNDKKSEKRWTRCWKTNGLWKCENGLFTMEESDWRRLIGLVLVVGTWRALSNFDIQLSIRVSWER